MESTPEPTDRKRRRPLRYSRFGSVLLSWDFIGFPLGFVVMLPSLFSKEVRDGLPTLLLGIGGFGAAVAALVLTALSVLLTTITPAYRRMLAKTPHGAKGVTTPFQIVIGTSAAAVVTGLGGAIAAPAVPDGFWLYLLSAVPVALLIWSVLGCMEVSRQLIWHWTLGMRAQDAEDRVRRASDGN